MIGVSWLNRSAYSIGGRIPVREVVEAVAGQNDHTASTAPRRGNLILSWGPLVLVCAAIFWFSSKPSLGASNALLTILTTWFGETAWYAQYLGSLRALDKVSSWIAHFSEYALLSLTAIWAVRKQWPNLPRPYALAFGITALYALSDELHQHFVPGRHADWRDVAMDWLGAAVALAFITVWQRRRATRTVPHS